MHISVTHQKNYDHYLVDGKVQTTTNFRDGISEEITAVISNAVENFKRLFKRV